MVVSQRGGGLAVVLDSSVSRSIGVRGVDGRGSVASVHSRGSVAGVHSWGSVRDDGLGDDSRGGVDGRGSVASVDGRGSMGSIDGRGGVRGVDGRGGVGNDGRGGMGHNGLGVDRRGRLADDGVESVHIIGGVVDGAHGTVRLDEGVLALHDITVAALDLRLDISGQTIVNTIVVGVFGVSLQRSATGNEWLMIGPIGVLHGAHGLGFPLQSISP